MPAGLVVQLVGGLASASSLFLSACGLSLIFGVTRVVNFAHGSMAMLGLYIAAAFALAHPGAAGFWGGIAIAVLAVGTLGALIERGLLRRIYGAPELLQLLATYALVLITRDLCLAIWGPADILGPRAPGLGGAVALAGGAVPGYDLLLIAIAPLVLGALWLLLSRTRLGLQVRAAAQDREMLDAMGVDPRRLYTAVFALGAGLAALGGALQMPREPANLGYDLASVGEAFVVVVVGGLGSLGGAYLAAVLIGLARALCYALGTVQFLGQALPLSKLALAIEFLVMAAVLVLRPRGLLGRAIAPPAGGRREFAGAAPALARRGELALAAGVVALLALVPLASAELPYANVLLVDALVAALFAASLQLLLLGGMPSFGHAAWFGLGAYAAALAAHGGAGLAAALGAATLAGGLGAALFGALAARVGGIYLAMLSLAGAQILWALGYEWNGVTGGSNGLVGIWPAAPFDRPASYGWLVLALAGGALLLLRRMLDAPLGFALRAVRDAPLRAQASGIDPLRVRWLAYALAGTGAGLAGGLFAFAKGSISPEVLAVERSVDGLLMVLLGGLHAAWGAVAGAALYTWLHDLLARHFDAWRAVLGAAILLLVLLFPSGLAGSWRPPQRLRSAGGGARGVP